MTNIEALIAAHTEGAAAALTRSIMTHDQAVPTLTVRPAAPVSALPTQVLDDFAKGFLALKRGA